MEITNRFSIISYVGSSPLNLMSKDLDIANNPIKNEQWDKMIQSVDTIYASQVVGGSSANSVPVFWTIRQSIVDRFGNTSFRYAPSPDSTLRSLDSKSSYYIILRDAGVAPIKLPANGEVILGYSDADTLPLVSPSLPDVILTESFKYDFKPQIVNLRPYETYSYSWQVVSSNWSVATNAISGILKPASSTGTINSTIAFCPTSAALPGSLPTSCALPLDDPYVTLKLSVRTLPAGAESFSDQFTITCKDCLPKARISIDSLSEINVQEDPSDDATTPFYDFKLSFNNLEAGQTYSYSISSIYSEWPIVFSTPTTGSFDARSSTHPSVYGKLFFCPTTGLCEPNEPTIPPYSVPNYPKFLTNDFVHNIILQATLEYNVPNYTINRSDPVTITYKKS